MKTIATGYKPRKHQKAFHAMIAKHRFSVAVAHRRFGKTVASLNQLIHSALNCDKPNPRFAYIAPTYSSAKRISLDYLREFTKNLDAEINIAELRCDFMGRRISLYGADNPDSLRGIYLDGCIVDEVAQISPNLFNEVIRPALSDRQGWCAFIGTPAGDNYFKKLRDHAEADEEWGLIEFKASDTGIIPQAELDSAKKSMGEDVYNQEFEINFHTPIVGAYYGQLLNEIEAKNHIREIPTENMTEKWTAWDLGMSDSTSIWVMETASGEHRAMDYYENHGQSLDHYVGWLKENGYFDYQHILPHDVNVRELGTGKSRLEVLTNAGLDIIVAPRMSVDDGIQAVRKMLPNTYFNKDKTKFGLECLRNYRRQYNDKLNTYTNSPLHDWSSHCADSFRYYAVGVGTQSKQTDWSKPITDDYKSAFV